ncbi:MAG: transposase, partial [Gammaproteobacteria bacterium]|nr:transposase [Gammaproteobacteria bacterium]
FKEHWNDILSWFDSPLSTAFIEKLNSLIQAAKRKARGYRREGYFITMAYLLGAKLDFGLPT